MKEKKKEEEGSRAILGERGIERKGEERRRRASLSKGAGTQGALSIKSTNGNK